MVKILLILIVLCATAFGEKPNIVVIITEDQGWGGIGYNSPGKVYTPNLDRLAAEGTCWFPTLGSLVGAKLPDNLDGADLSPILFGEGALSERDLYWIWNPKTNRWALRYGDWKIVRYSEQEPAQTMDWEMYNLKDDPKEKKYVAAGNPEVVELLHNLFLKQRAKDTI